MRVWKEVEGWSQSCNLWLDLGHISTIVTWSCHMPQAVPLCLRSGLSFFQASRWLSSKESACSAGDTGDRGLILGSGRSPGAGHGNPLQYSCLDRGAWQATVLGITKSQTWLKQLSMHAVVKNLLAYVGDAGDTGSIPGSGRPPGEGNGNPLQYSCLGNSMDRRVWWDAVHGVTKSWTWLRLSTSPPFNPISLILESWSRLAAPSHLEKKAEGCEWAFPTFTSQPDLQAPTSKSLDVLQRQKEALAQSSPSSAVRKPCSEVGNWPLSQRLPLQYVVAHFCPQACIYK